MPFIDAHWPATLSAIMRPESGQRGRWPCRVARPATVHQRTGLCRCGRLTRRGCCTLVLHVSGHPRPGCHRQTGHWSPRFNSVRGSSAHPCLADFRRGVAKLARMRRILLGAVAGVLLLAVGTRAADALGIGGPRLRCGCTETCWCKRPGLTVLRWVTPGRWHHIGLTAEEKQSHHSQA